jgi:HK97 family phage major capsid protein
MKAVEMLQADLKAKLAEVRGITDAADTEGRGVSPAEREAVDKGLERIAELKARIEDEQDKERIREAVDGFANLHVSSMTDPNPVREPATPTRYKTIGEALVNSDPFKSWSIATKAAGRAVQFTTPSVEVPYKTAGDPVLESDNTNLFGTGGDAGALTTMFGLETPGYVQRRLMIADLLPSVPITSGNSASYPIVKTRGTISGTPQTEGSSKAAGEYEFDVETAVLVTIAGWVKVSTQFLEDAPGLMAYINSDLPYQVRYNEETYLATALYSAAGAADAITGGTAQFDGILDAKLTVQNHNYDPNVLLIHPNDWGVLLSEKFESGTGGYIGGGPFSATTSPWGLRPVVTQAATEGTPLVGDFTRGAKVFRRGGMAVSSTNSDQDDFVKNLLTVRAEIRCVIGVIDDEAFAEATVSS